jgi:hypothetical protein
MGMGRGNKIPLDEVAESGSGQVAEQRGFFLLEPLAWRRID